MKEEYIKRIVELLNKTDDLSLLDFIYLLLFKIIKRENGTDLSVEKGEIR